MSTRPWLLLVLTGGLAGCLAPSDPPAAPASSVDTPALDWWSTVHARIEADSRAFRPVASGPVASGSAGLTATTVSTTATLDAEGLALPTGLRLHPAQIGRVTTGHLAAHTAAPPTLGACTPDVAPDGTCIRRAETDDGVATGWWRTRADGFEQGWDVPARPLGDGPLTVRIPVTGSTSLLTTQHTARITDTSGRAWTYGAATAVDSTGRPLPVRLATEAGAIVVTVDDTGAAYPLVIDPVLAPAETGTTLTGTGSFGAAVSAAGDVNGDGYDDVLVGAPDDGDGRAFLFLGSADGLATASSTTFAAPTASGRFGASAVAIGDVNADGYADLAIGAPAAGGGAGLVAWYAGTASGPSTTPTGTFTGTGTAALGTALAAGDFDGDGHDDLALGAPGAGTVSLHTGTAGGLSAGATTLSGAALARFGAALAAVDLDGDGLDDLAVGAPSTGAGAFSVYAGTATGLSTTARSTVTGTTSGDEFGASLSTAGNVNGDARSDLLVGAPGAGGGRGEAHIYAGSASAFGAAPLTTFTGSVAAGRLGASVAGGGDTNGDGYEDVVVGVPGADTVLVHLGSRSGPGTTPARTLTSATPGDSLGASLALVGDVNGDGHADVLAGAPDGGSAVLLPGSDAGPRWTAGTILTGEASSSLGLSTAGAGDVDGDGYDDVLVGAPTWSASLGRAYLYRGSAHGLALTPSQTWTGTTTGDGLGGAVASIGDLTGDGYPDIAIGAPGVTSGTGAVYVYAGGPSGPGTTPLSTTTGTTTGGDFGLQIAAAGDVNRDGRPDVVIGAPYYSSNRGRAYVFHGSTTGLGASANTVIGGNASEYCGSAVAGAGDVNGDGYGDVVVGGYNNSSGAGRARVFFGSATGVPSAANVTISGSAGAALGAGVDGAGDVNGDGYADLLVGAPGAGLVGAAYLYLGSATGPSTTASTTWSGTALASLFGARVARVGDVNGDGYDDIAVAAPYYSSYSGRVSVFQGSATGLAATPTVELDGPGSNGYFGAALGPAGDVDGDGYDDFVVGAGNYATATGRSYVYYGYAVDDDGDGSIDIAVGGNDCDDHDAATLPAAPELCDGVDNDCDGAVDEDPTDPTAWYADVDGDGYGDASADTFACVAPSGTVADATDCDDSRATVHPGAAETCNSRDDDCDGTVDDAATDASPWYADADGDGYGDPASDTSACIAPSGTVADATDCDDTRSSTHPGAAETCNSRDDDCDGAVDESATDATTWYADTDGDGYGDPATTTRACTAPAGYVATATDCDDTRVTVHPGATETCDGLDDDCDGTIDESGTDALAWYADADADGYGDPAATTRACTAPAGTVADATDCDDTRASVHPGAPETCNSLDDDCDGTVDESATDASTWYTDADGDGYGDPTSDTSACIAPAGTVADATDCDDTRSSIHPGAAETCDSLDDDCDGAVDESATDALPWYADTDGDGYGDPAVITRACTTPAGSVADATDCDDADATVHPGAPETCDSVDDDCDGAVDEAATDAPTWYADTDADGYGDPAADTSACIAPTGTVADGTDCVDTDATIHPGAAEACDDPTDRNCDGSVGYADADADGTPACLDCDDTNGDAHPGATEICDGFDDDCDGTTDVDAADATAWYDDADGDGYGDDRTAALLCTGPDGTVSTGGDCDDDEAASFPGNPELCDGLDNDCDGDVDEDLPVETTYTDADGDGFGDPATASTGCDPGADPVTDGTDCDDDNPAAHPGANETCDGFDDDCDGYADAEPFEGVGWSICDDQDGDGLLDYDEVAQYGTDPTDADTDHDGLNDGDEIALGTDPHATDSDYGGVSDGDEVDAGTDPLDPSDDATDTKGGCGCGTTGGTGGTGSGEAGLLALTALAGLAAARRRRP